jgi:hypothetical protein
MKESITVPGRRSIRTRWVVPVLVLLAAFAGVTLLAVARPQPTLSVTIQNNSQAQIRALYVAVGDPNNWGPDQLNGSAVAPGASYTLNLSCDGSSVRVITEDQNGCFLYHPVSCDGNSTWTITDSETPDCGG